jgi:3-methylfumaryl-CoA hydratase
VGRTRKEEDEVTLGAVRRMAAMLDQDPDIWRYGSEMPESWYVILFGPIALQRALVRDGHLPAGDFLPPMGDARRMFGGVACAFIDRYEWATGSSACPRSRERKRRSAAADRSPWSP